MRESNKVNEKNKPVLTLIPDPQQQLYLEIPPQLPEKAWERSEYIPDSVSRWQVYLNRLLLETFCHYLQQEYSLHPHTAPMEVLESVWVLLNGTAVNIGERRLILLPTEILDDEEVYIPQEWVDIPSWLGDYYIISEVNPDEHWLRILGFTTHKRLKQQAFFSYEERCYVLSKNELFSPGILGTILEFCPEEITIQEVDSLPAIDSTQAENLISRLANPNVSPRLELPFKIWAYILENQEYLTKIAQARIGCQPLAKNPVTVIRKWLQNSFPQSWQPPEKLGIFATAIRSFDKKLVRCKQVEIGNCRLFLCLEVSKEKRSKFAVRVELYPGDGSLYIPPSTQLILLSKSGEVLKNVQAREKDNCIAIQRFRVAENFEFQIEIKKESQRIKEYFIV